MKSLVSITVTFLWMLFALSSCATQDAHVAAPRQIQMHIFFTEENNKVTILRVRRTPPPGGGGGIVDVPQQPGKGPGGSTLGTLVTYTKNPNCISLNMPGGGFYEICL